MKQSTEARLDKREKQRNFLLVLPAIVLPFTTFLLWSLGLVGSTETKAASTAGLNMQLPDAKLKDNKSWNKLSFYEQADKDSAKYREAVKSDPFFTTKNDSLTGDNRNLYPGTTSGYNPLPPNYQDLNELKVNQKLAELNAVLNRGSNDDNEVVNRNAELPSNIKMQSKDVNRLEQMMKMMNQKDSDADPETEQLNGMMDKILDIQHPSRVIEKIQQTSEKHKREVFPVITKQDDNAPSLLQNSKPDKSKKISPMQQNAFYSLTEDSIYQITQNAIKAEVQVTQTLVSGSTIKLSLQNDVYINGVFIPQGTFIYGLVNLNAERLNIQITSIQYQNNILPVSLSAYDLDGLPGVYIPGTISRDVAKQSGSEAVSNIGINSLDPSIGAQAANVGIQAAKTLINKKVKQVKVTVKAGYQVLLKDENQKP